MFAACCRARLPMVLGCVAVAVGVALSGGCSTDGPDALGGPIDAGVGTLRISIHWPAPDGAAEGEVMAQAVSDQGVGVREIPAETRSIVVTVTGSGIATPITESVTRPEGPAPVTEVRLRVPPGGDRTVRVEARGIDGIVLASRQLVVDVMEGATTSVDVALRPVIERVEIAPNPCFVEWGTEQTLTPTAYDPYGRVVPVGDTWSWSSDAEGVFSVDAAGAIQQEWRGSGIVTVTETESGKSAQAEVTITLHPPSIAFHSNRSGSFQLWAMEPDGTGLVQLTRDTDGNAQYPVWSPDGAQVAFASSRSGSNEIYTMRADGTQVHRLTHLEANSGGPDWSPSGDRLVFHSDADGKRELYTVGVDGTGLTQITDFNGPDATGLHSADWSPYGDWIAFQSNHDGDVDIYLVRPDGTEVLRRQRAYADEHVRWSPDGTLWALANDGGVPANHEVHIVRPDGSEVAQLTSHGATDYRPAWSPDGSRIAFMSNRAGDWEIYVMASTDSDGDGNGDDLVRLTTHAATDGAPAWRW